MSRVALGLGLLVALAGCARPSVQQVNRGFSLPPPVQAQRPAFQGEPGEAVWHLRAGLNVAALSCRGRGRTPVTGYYSRVLSRHKTLLSQAYAGEQRRYGKGLDSHQTKLYNRFSNQRNPTEFCASAASVAKQAATMDSPTLAVNARSLLGRID
jgi:hypothetical protein